MIQNNLIKKSIYILLAVSILLTAMVVWIPCDSVFAEFSVNFDNTDVMDDLNSCTIDGESFDINDYPKDPYGTPEVLTFVEYCYSFYVNNNQNYGLYIYVYNPALTKFEDSHLLNKIQMAVSFNEMDYADNYKKFNLKFCSKSSDGLFYKYKVVDPDNTLLSMVQEYSNTHSGARQYYISGIELVKKGEYNATEYNVSMNYNYSGFADGYGDSENFPLTMTSSGIETLQTEVHYTWWRPEGETEGGNQTQSQLNSVYFSVPTRLIDKYGILQAVHMEWYEYLTKWCFVVGEQDVYNALKSYIGEDIGQAENDLPYGLIVNHGHPADGANNEAVYNFPLASVGSATKEIITELNYLFKSDTSNAKDYVLSGEELLTYIQNYKGSGDKINDKYYSELFEDYVGENRKIGYQDVTVKADDKYSLTSYTLSQNFWQKLLHIPNYEVEEFKDIKAIEEITSDDLLASDDAISKKFFINKEDVQALKNFCNDAYTDSDGPLLDEDEPRTVFILRYAVTDYTSKSVLITGQEDKKTEPDWECRYEYSQNAYAFKQTAFLDLDLIDVTFYKDGVSTVIPVVSNPVDGVADGTPPVEKPDWLKYLLSLILGIVILILVLWLLGPILPWILKGVIWVITLPFRAIKAIIKSLKKKE